jgi:triosephosphate isomerase
MPVPMVAGNWKMNTSVSEAVQLASSIRDGMAEISGVDLVICPPYLSLSALSEALLGSGVRLGAQNMHFEASGAFTGEVSPPMLQGICEFVILGHSERRQLFGETDASVNRKVKAAMEHGLRPILCVGESLEQRESDGALDVVSAQVRAGLQGVDDITGLVLAYEPVWAIGTGQAATPEVAAEMMQGALFEPLSSLYGPAAADVPLLYGGSVNAGNVGTFAAKSSIHGALVGGASLQADSFLEIARLTAAAKAAL